MERDTLVPRSIQLRELGSVREVPKVDARHAYLQELEELEELDNYITTPGALCLLQDGGGGIGKHLAPQDNIRGVRILSEVVADAPDARDE